MRIGCLVLVLLAAGVTAGCKTDDAAVEPAAEAGVGGEVEMPPMEMVTASSLNVRAIPSTKGTVLGTLKKGQEVRVLEEKDGWKKVQSDGVAPEGWVAGEFLKSHGAPQE